MTNYINPLTQLDGLYAEGRWQLQALRISDAYPIGSFKVVNEDRPMFYLQFQMQEKGWRVELKASFYGWVPKRIYAAVENVLEAYGFEVTELVVLVENNALVTGYSDTHWRLLALIHANNCYRKRKLQTYGVLSSECAEDRYLYLCNVREQNMVEIAAAAARRNPCFGCSYATGETCLPCAVNPLAYGHGCRDYEAK